MPEWNEADLASKRRRAYEAAAGVRDPEIPVLTIADLGILHDVSIGPGGRIDVVILPTYSGCPAMGIIQIEVETALARAGFAHANVRLSHSPPWSTDRMSDEGREKLRACGIAPPSRGAGKRSLFETGEEVACPRCGSPGTERISEFGSTACKALWRCTSCREPFDYFKCI
ncbi:MAG: phenylacetate-CoA oxygenase subunit PaaJ [Hyphomicrobiaceae bacterium]|nr:phenylacetate-CoA oxygenase subunit PaaJ [Hyphomicrobiaceae bacterium]